MSTLLRFHLGSVFAASFVLANTALAQFNELVSRIPPDANTIVLIDVGQLQQSPKGQREGWADNHAKAFEAGLSIVPPSASKFVASAQLDFSTFDPVWELSIAELEYEASMAGVAARLGGDVDKISGKDVAVLPGDRYVVKFGPRLVAAGAPARRQEVSRWIGRIYSGSLPGLSEYLQEATQFANSGSPIIMAIDLSDTFSEGEIRTRIEEFDALKGEDVDKEAIISALASLRGVSLGVTVSDRMVGAIKIDFGKDVAALSDVGKPLLLEILNRRGAAIDDFNAWELRAAGNRLQLQGELSASGLRRILSLLSPPPELRLQLQDSSGDSKEREQLLASKQYFSSVTTLIEDLEADVKRRKTLGQISVWFDRYAEKIDNLPILNVDPDLLGYGEYVSSMLRTGRAAVTNAAARRSIRQAQVPDQYDVSTYSEPIGVTSNWYGTNVYSWNTWTAVPNRNRKGQMISEVRMQEEIAGANDANTVLQKIDEATKEIRRHMTQKYSSEF